MRTLIFSICAQNYVGLAAVLGASVRDHGAATDFRIYVADAIEGGAAAPDCVPAGPALAGIIDPTEFANMAFMYDVTEFCTALKAACFLHAFADGYDRCIYFDPDILLMSDLNRIISELDDCSILMTPHLCRASPDEGPRADRGILSTGVYNLGFLGLRRSAVADLFLRWWHQRLRHQAFSDSHDGLYTDQRWMDLVPSLFPNDDVRVWRHLGCNVAPWNYHERQIELDHDRYMVRVRAPAADERTAAVPLIFLHFSGFDFRQILEGRFDQLNLPDAAVHEDLRPLYALYGSAIRAVAEDLAQHLARPYGFGKFADGTSILSTHRRLFRVWRERHGTAVDPFVTGSGSFHQALKVRRLLGRGGPTEIASDKATIRTIDHPEKLLARARMVFRYLFKMVGRKYFFFLVRGINRLSHVENHYDTFMLDDAEIKSVSDTRTCEQ